MISVGFLAFARTRLHRLVQKWTRGRGAILMFHHVRPAKCDNFAPNRLLEITPEFLGSVIVQLRASGFDILSMDEALQRLARPMAKGENPFAVMTFDDGYCDNRDFALPVLRQHETPFTLYVTTGFADRSARLWWRELEAAIGKLSSFSLRTSGAETRFLAQTDAQKSAAFHHAYWLLRGMGEDAMLAEIARLGALGGVEPKTLVADACMDWDALGQMAQDPLCTIGVHTLTHPMLAKHDAEFMCREMSLSREIIEGHIGRPARHLSYPVGDGTSAGPREFAMAAQLGFASAVTTRPGMILQAHADRLTSLPRLSINGKWQSAEAVDVLLSGAPFALLNRGQAA